MAEFRQKRKEQIRTLNRSDIFCTAEETYSGKKQQQQSKPRKIRDNFRSNVSFNILDKEDTNTNNTNNFNKNNKSNKSNSFIPSFNADLNNPHARKVKEFYNTNLLSADYDPNKVKNSTGHIQKSKEKNNPNRKVFSKLNYKEKKVLETCPHYSHEQIQNHIKTQNNNSENSRNFNALNSNSNNSKNKTSKEMFYTNMTSNIFNDKTKDKKNKTFAKFSKNNDKNNKDKDNEHLNANNRISVVRNPKNNSNTIETEPSHNRNNNNLNCWNAKLDWKEINGELYFHKKKPSKKLNPAESKIEGLKSHMDNNSESITGSTTKENSMNYNNYDDKANQVVKNKIEEGMKQKYYYMTSTQLKKSVDLSSSIHHFNFYKENLNISSNTRETKTFEISNIQDFDRINLDTELKSLAAKNK